MAAPVGPKKVHRYSLEFKIQAVKLANHPEIQTQDVAHALDIHPFMLSKWKKDYREGKLRPAAEAAGLSLPKVLRVPKADPEKRALKKQPDGSLLADGKPQAGDAYTLVFHTHQQGISALRLQALAEKAGPGRGPDGDFLLTDIDVVAAPLLGKEKAINVKLRPGVATAEKKGQPFAFAVDSDKKTGWSVGPGNKSQAAVIEFETPVGTIKRRLHVARNRLRKQLERLADRSARRDRRELICV